MLAVTHPDVLQALRDRYDLTKPHDMLIADEYSASGSTLEKAEKVLANVFPDADQITRTGIFARCPQWYSDPELLDVEEQNPARTQFTHTMYRPLQEPPTYF